MTLTAKQEKFCQGIADGLTQADAYRAAYGAGSMKAETIYSRASELMADGKVTARVGELRGKLATKALWTREMSVQGLVAAYKVAKEVRSASGMTGAVKELNAMHGYNAPVKAEVDHRSTDGSMTPKLDLSKLSDTALSEILAARDAADRQ